METIGIWIGLFGGLFRACMGFVYKKAKDSKVKFKAWKFMVTLIEASIGGLVLGLLVNVTDIRTGIALALAAAGMSEIAGKTGLHDILSLKKQ